MKLFFFGAGKVGTSLAGLFSDCGHEVLGFFDPPLMKTSHQSVCLENSREITLFGTLAEIRNLNPHLIFVCVPESELEKCLVIAQGCASEATAALVHCSGGVQLNLQKYHLPVVCAHPAMAFPAKNLPADTLRQAIFVLSGTKSGIPVVADLLRSCGCQVATPERLMHSLYHCACVFASNFLATNAAAAEIALIQAGLDQTQANKVVTGLIQSVARAGMRGTYREAITGPAIRGESAIIQEHIKILSSRLPREFKLVYEACTKLLVRISNVSSDHTLPFQPDNCVWTNSTESPKNRGS